MRKVFMIMFMTIDGRAQFPIYPPDPKADADDEDPMWLPRMKTIDTLLLGRKAYDLWAGYWPAQKSDPKASEWQKNFSRFADAAEKVVFSKTLKQGKWEKTRIVRGSPAEEVAKLRKEKGGNLALGGGPRIAQAFLADGAVDEMLLAVFPSIVSRGKPMFHTVDEPDLQEDRIPLGAPGRQDFKLLDSKPLSDGTMFLHYARRG